MGEFRMPSLGADMEAGTIVEWLVAPGDAVHRGDIIAVVDTDKATIEVEVFESGTVGALLVAVGEKVPIGTVLATITPTTAEDATVPSVAAVAAVAAVEPTEPTEPAVPALEPLRDEHPRTTSPLVRHLAERDHVDLAAVAGTGVGGTITRADVDRAARDHRPSTRAGAAGEAGEAGASPFARRLAAERGIDLATITGSGPGGAVVARDLDGARGRAPDVPAPTPAPTPSTGPARDTLQDSLAALMARSKREIPHYYLSTTIDFGPATDWLTAENEARPVSERLLPAALLLRATVLAVQDAPRMNGHFVDGGFRPSEAVHLGVAVRLRGGGLIAPAIRDAHELSLDGLMARLRDLVTRARAGKLRASEMTDPTITVTNLGDQGVDSVFGVIYPPQVAMVGFGRVAERPWSVEGMLTVRPVVHATLSGDHRVSAGHQGARFLDAVSKHLRSPERLQ